ncbi:MAG: hypothetical protein AAFY19_11455 [Pseudomonadota bacterium]
MREISLTPLALALPLTLAACASGGSGSGAPYSTPRTASPAPPPGSFRGPPMPSQGGLDGLTGAQASTLMQRFGSPRIDLKEGDARKLQFVGQACVLDVFLYPASAGAEPVATHVEARLREGGAATDTRQCIREVESQR